MLLMNLFSVAGRREQVPLFPLQTVLFPALVLNPVDLARILTTLAVGSGTLFGPTSAVVMKMFGSTGGVALGLTVMALETAIPLAIAAHVFRRRDW